MADYIDVIYHTPLYVYHFMQTAWIVINHIPHYSWDDYGKLAKGFVWLIPLRIVYGVVFPERVIIKKVQGRVSLRRKSRVKPSKTDHQVASAVIDSVLHHHL